MASHNQFGYIPTLMFLKRVALLSGLLIIIFVMVGMVCGLAFGIPQIWMSSLSPVRGTTLNGQIESQNSTLALSSGQVAEIMAMYQALESPAISAIQARLGNLQPGSDGIYAFTVTATEINEILAQSVIAPRDSNGMQLQILTVGFTDGLIDMSARVNQPFSAELIVSLTPQVENGDLRFMVENVSLGRAQAPEILLMPLQGLIDEAMQQALESVPEGVAFQTVTVADGQITITGQLL